MKYIYRDEFGFWCNDKYLPYLVSIRGTRSDQGWDDLLQDRRFAPDGEGTLNDSWLQRLDISIDDVRKRNTDRMTVRVELMGPQFDRIFKLTYFNVRKVTHECFNHYLDLQYFEVLVEPDGFVRHEIEFVDEARIMVEAESLAFEEVFIDPNFVGCTGAMRGVRP